MTVTARQIVGLLAARAESNHHVFFDEVTDYGNYGERGITGHQGRIDAIAIKPAYSKIQIWGYEVKVSRRDFVQDEKWHTYLGMCNNLYFVCPHGVIGKDEVPAEAGLIYVSKNGSMLRTVKKAPYRTVDYRSAYFMGMIFNKCGVIEGDNREARLAKAIRLSTACADAAQAGRLLGSKLAHRLHEQQAKQAKLDTMLTELAEVREYLKEQGIYTDDGGIRERKYGHQTLQQRLAHKKQQAVVDSGSRMVLMDAERTARNLLNFVDNLQREHDKIDAEENAEDTGEEVAG